MQWCDLFILPSLRETFGIVLGEAMACGKPVVATRCGGAEFLVTPETGQLVEPANPTLLADAIEQWASMRDSYDSVAIRKHIVDRFGESAFLQNVSAWYDRILGL
jgi:glycosyltransferase involved in cell wall biosynthesis